MEGPNPRFISLRASAVLREHSSDFVPLFQDIRPLWVTKREPDRMASVHPTVGFRRIDKEKLFSDGTYFANRILGMISKVLEEKVDITVGTECPFLYNDPDFLDFHSSLIGRNWACSVKVERCNLERR